MSAALEIVSAGASASLQDTGRFGHRRIGVPWSGALDPALLAIANRLVGNAADTPAIECFDGGQVLAAVDGPVRVAVAGNATLELERDGERRTCVAWRSFVLAPGDALRIRRIDGARVAMLALAGIDVPRMLGSASAHARSGLGGGWLACGDRITARAFEAGAERILDTPPRNPGPTVRVVPGPQADHFDAVTQAAFLATDYRVGTAADRMGLRLEGPPIAHRAECGAEIVSDAIVPGAIQVPGHGQPIVLLADAQTAGGYPKIATVISADLPWLATRKPGDIVRFAAVTARDGETAAREAYRALEATLARIRALPADGPDLTALYSENLVGGVVDALAPPPQNAPD